MEVKLVSTSQYVGDLFGNKELTPEQLYVAIARVSSDRTLTERADDIEGLIKYCVKEGHWSIFDMVDLTYYIKTSLPISVQMLRHASFKFQMFSQRYQQVKVAEAIEFRAKGKTNRQSSEQVVEVPKELLERIQKLLLDNFDMYEILVNEFGVSMETARFILPLCVSTELFMKGSLRSWIHYLKQRVSEHAQKEHREIAQIIYKDIAKLYPITFKALEGIDYFKK